MQDEQTRTSDHVLLQRPEDVPLQTFKRSFAEICQGEDPWIPLGNFMHQFFGYYRHRRTELVLEAIDVPDHLSLEQVRWAVLCAASVEYLCTTYGIPCPAWALDPRYTLATPWYEAIGAELPEVQEELRHTTPEAFSKRNIFCGDSIFKSKYEYKGRQERKTA